MSRYDASIAITTHNRKEILPECIDSCLAQSLGERLQIVVVDDGSSDGTSEFLAERYGDVPNIKLDSMHPGIGLIAERSRFADLVDSPVIISIDDDAVFPSSNTVEQTLAQMEDDRVGAVAIPYIDVLKDDKSVRQRAPDDSVTWVTSQYRGTAHALRVDLFEKAGRYRGQLWRQNEETDLCVRLLDAGGFVALGTADPIHHMESPKRSKPEIFRYSVRNSLWVSWWNVPMPW
ncbi:MAG: glycosyltransferase family 2 protein, partial [Planctomycetota bacterium]